MWTEFFILTHPSFVVPGIGEFNISNNLSVELLLKAYERGCPYINLTHTGQKKFYPQQNSNIKKVESSIPLKPIKKGKKNTNKRPV